MDIKSFHQEWDNLSKERKRRFLNKLFSTLTDNPDDHEDLLLDLLDWFIEAEDNDYFGTEGFDG